MNNHLYLHTSESVSAGHPDKVCDQISDAILDAYLKENPYAHIAVEAMATTNRVILAGEVTGAFLSHQRIEDIVRDVVKAIGYDQQGFSYKTLELENYIHDQSADIAMGVGNADQRDEGAGDQGLMFGYATNENQAFMPAPLYYAHRVLENLHTLRVNKYPDILGPDAKSQVTVMYEDWVPKYATNIVLSTQHNEDTHSKDLIDIVMPIITDSLPETWANKVEAFFINPTGRFVIGGPDGDTGLTGRKIIVDTYGGAAPHGGGAFSGKDPTKVDRSAAYMMRYLAKNIVAAGVASRCTIQISYVIGKADPLSLYVNTHNSGKVSNHLILKCIKDNFDLTPKGIRNLLRLNRPIYLPSASYGHFGREPGQNGTFSWEKLDAVDVFTDLLTRHGN